MLVDPNSYYTRAHYGWHFYQLGDWMRAWWWCQRSLSVKPDNNIIAASYQKLALAKIEEEKAAKH
jgi:hypothetical protein